MQAAEVADTKATAVQSMKMHWASTAEMCCSADWIAAHKVLHGTVVSASKILAILEHLHRLHRQHCTAEETARSEAKESSKD